jgi:Fe2+ or Zn2+ uptake regulation protein
MTYESEKIDEEILDYLSHSTKECKTRRILDHLQDEFCDDYKMFSRSTLWRHLQKLEAKGLIKKRITCDGQGLAMWSVVK